MHFSTVLLVSLANCAFAATTLTTQFGGDELSEGNIFEIAARTKSIAVTGLSINFDNGTGDIKIETRPGPGRVVDLDDDGWIVINSFTGVIGQGRSELTPLPDFDVPVVIPAGTKLAFYVTASLNNAPGSIWCSVGSSLGSVYASNDDLEVAEGYAAESHDTGLITWKHPRRWNGAIRYSVSNAQLASVGIPKISLAPSHNDPSKSSSSSVCQYPSSYPSLLPMAKFLGPTSTTTDGNEMPSDTPSSNSTSKPTDSPLSSARTSATSTLLSLLGLVAGFGFVLSAQ